MTRIMVDPYFPVVEEKAHIKYHEHFIHLNINSQHEKEHVPHAGCSVDHCHCIL